MNNVFINLEYFFYQIYRLFTHSYGVDIDPSVDDKIAIVKMVMWTIAFFAVIGIAYYGYKLKLLVDNIDKELHLQTKSSAKPVTAKNRDWERYLQMIDGDNPAEWRIAILEADKMLESLTIQLGFQGDSLGERLKNADTSRMTTLESAWEAHKMRNRIAHEHGHVLTKRDARKAIILFETVFREFNLV